MVNDFLSTCGAFDLGAIPVFDGDCPKAEAPYRSQLQGLIIKPNNSRPFTYTSALSVGQAISNADTDNNTSRYLMGAGGIASEDHVVVLGRATKVLAGRLFTVTFDVAITCDTTFAFLRRLSQNWNGFKFWGYTLNERLIGGAGGIAPSFVTVSLPTGAGRTDVERAILTIEFRADVEPERSALPNLLTLAAV